jgi:hypothetical protein
MIIFEIFENDKFSKSTVFDKNTATAARVAIFRDARLRLPSK